MRTALGIVLVLFLSSSTWAGEPPASGDPASRNPARSTGEAQPIQITESFKDVPVAQVVQKIARVGKLNVILSPKVKGSVSIELKACAPWVALEQVAARVGASYQVEGFGLSTIVSLAEAELVQGYHHFVSWRPRQTGPLAGANDPLFAHGIASLVLREGGQWRYIEADNAVVFSARASTVRAIETLLGAMDKLVQPQPLQKEKRKR